MENNGDVSVGVAVAVDVGVGVDVDVFVDEQAAITKVKVTINPTTRQ